MGTLVGAFQRILENIRSCLSPQFPYAGYSNEKFETETLSGGNQETRNFLVWFIYTLFSYSS